jgi:hypothetical protein
VHTPNGLVGARTTDQASRAQRKPVLPVVESGISALWADTRSADREDYVGVALDETISRSDHSLQFRWRVDRLLAELVAIAPPGPRECMQARIERA